MTLETTTITDLPDATTPLTGTERVPMDRAGATNDATTQDIANLAPSPAPLTRGQASKMTTGSITLPEDYQSGQYVSTGLTATLDSSVANDMALGTSDQFGLKNTSGVTKVFDVYGSIDAKNGNNLTLGVKLAKNGTEIDESECRAFTGSGGEEAKLVTKWMIELDDDDEVSLMIANHSNTSNLELRRGRIVAIEVR